MGTNLQLYFKASCAGIIVVWAGLLKKRVLGPSLTL